MSTQLLALTALTALTTESATLLASSYSVNGNEPTSGAKLLASAPNTDATHLFDALQRTLACEDAHRHTGSAKYTTPAQEEVTVELVRYIGGEKLELVLALDLLETAHPSVYAANISKTPTTDRVWRQDSLLLECAFTMLVPELEGHSAPEGYTWAQARKHAEEARQQARAIIAAWVATETETETETPSNEVLDSLFMVDHGDIRTGADILEDKDTTLHALKVALNEGVCDEQNTALVTLVRRVTFYAEETRKEALTARAALAILKNEHPTVYAFINKTMREEYGYLWTRRLDLAHESLLIGMWEDLGCAPPKGYRWSEAFEAIDDAWDEAHGN